MMLTLLKQNPALKKLGLGLVFFCAIAVITRVALQLGTVVNPATVAFSFLIVVLLSAVFSGVEVANRYVTIQLFLPSADWNLSH
jgi:predicted tellurium resistance membrane protein TerC